MVEILATERRIKSTGRGAEHFGSCERCGRHCSEHYVQQWRRQYRITSGTRVGHVGWTFWDSAGYGHVECLRGGAYADVPVVEYGAAEEAA
jgi:hypothetical protein